MTFSWGVRDNIYHLRDAEKSSESATTKNNDSKAGNVLFYGSSVPWDALMACLWHTQTARLTLSSPYSRYAVTRNPRGL